MLLVDVNNAGEGNLEIAIETNGRNIKNQVRQLAAGRFEVNYTPRSGGRYHANVTFNSLHVAGK